MVNQGKQSFIQFNLFAIVRDRRQDGPERLEAHGDVQQMGGEEEVIVVTEDGHAHVPGQIQERLQDT